MEGSKGYQEPDSSLTVCDVCCIVHQKLVPLVGSPALPFIDQGGSRGYRWEKEKNTKSIEGPSKDPSLPFFPRLPCITWQIVSGVACLLIFIGHALASFSKCVRPVLPSWAACRTWLFISDPVGSGWRGDCSFVTAEDGSPRLERSGCRMSVSDSSP